MAILNSASMYRPGNINFQDEEKEEHFTYPVNYKGMNPEAMSYTGPSQWNWTYIVGWSYYANQPPVYQDCREESTSEYRNFVEYKVTALNSDFGPIL